MTGWGRQSAADFRLASLLAIGWIVLGAGATSAQEPLVKQGLCPSGYYSSGSYCVPGQDARPAVPKVGLCPSGYLSSGNYCVASDAASSAVPRKGLCPTGYISSGDYCVKSR